MLKKLLLIICCSAAHSLYAQQHGAPGGYPSQKLVPPGPEMMGYKEIGAPLPDFIVHTLDDKIITNRDVRYNANLFVMIFNPTCSHCEAMTDLLEKNIALFNKTKVLMVATAPMQPYLKDFEDRHHTDQYPTLMVSLDSSKIIDRIFLYKMLPQINIYDGDRKLIKSFASGDLPIDSLKQYIQ